MPDFDHDRHEVVQSAFQEGIRAFLCPAEITEPRSVRITCDLSEKYADVIVSGGGHPHKAKDFTADSLKAIEKLAKDKKIHAVGEIGLDFHYNLSPAEQQIKVFRRQLSLAQKLDLPVIIHSRQAAQDIIHAIREERFTRGGVLHCFTEDWEFAQKMLDQNFFISFSGIVTFPKAHELRETARKIPLEYLLVETDSPYLAPVPLRGKIKRNEPKFIVEIALFLAGLKNVSLGAFAVQTTQNFSSLFGFEISNTRC